MRMVLTQNSVPIYLCRGFYILTAMNIYYHLSIVLKFLLGKVHAHTHPSSLYVYQHKRLLWPPKLWEFLPVSQEAITFGWTTVPLSPRPSLCDEFAWWANLRLQETHLTGTCLGQNMRSVRSFCTFPTGPPLGTGSSPPLSSWAVREASQAQWLHFSAHLPKQRLWAGPGSACSLLG